MFFCALRTQTEYVKFVFFLDIAMFFHKFLLQLFQFRAVNFLEFTTIEANKMVVVFMPVLVLITQGTISKINLSAYTRIAHKFDSPGHRRIANTFMFFSYQITTVRTLQVL